MSQVALGAGGLCESLPKGAIHLVMGTHGVAVVRQLEARHRDAGQTLVAAPVLGRPDLAASGQLGIVVAGPEAAVARCNELLTVDGPPHFRRRRQTRIGDGHQAREQRRARLRDGRDGRRLRARAQVRRHAAGVSRRHGRRACSRATAYKVYGQKMVDESYDQVGSPIHVGLKDANLIAAAADLARVPMPSHNVYRDRLLGAVAHGDGDRDQAVLAREQARASGLE